MPRHARAVIRQNTRLTNHHNLLTLALPENAPVPSPGQFYMVEVHRGNDPLLKRAFSLFRRVEGGIQLLFRIQGRGTDMLREMPAGASLDLLGPLGNFYPPPPSGRTPIVVAGGIGIASVFSLIERLSGATVVFYGARNSEELFMLGELRELSKELHVSTDDGSQGEKGLVTASLERYLSSEKAQGNSYCLYACGPRPMLKEVSRVAEDRRVVAYVSLEEHMACGIGACLGCVVRVKQREFVADESALYQRVCKEGPVFDSREIAW